MSLCLVFWICCILFLSSIFCELPPHTFGLKPTTIHILDCDWPLCGPSVTVLLLPWSVWHGPSPDQHQHGECADVHGCTYLPLVLCLCKEAGGGRGNNVYWLRAGKQTGGLGAANWPLLLVLALSD